MSSRLMDRLGQARHRQFVGRTVELELFQSALSAAELPYNVMYIHGPGGVGKTSLVTEFTRCAEVAGIPAYYVDARAIEPTPDAVIAALRTALNLAPSESALP